MQEEHWRTRRKQGFISNCSRQVIVCHCLRHILVLCFCNGDDLQSSLKIRFTKGYVRSVSTVGFCFLSKHIVMRRCVYHSFIGVLPSPVLVPVATECPSFLGGIRVDVREVLSWDLSHSSQSEGVCAWVLTCVWWFRRHVPLFPHYHFTQDKMGVCLFSFRWIWWTNRDMSLQKEHQNGCFNGKMATSSFLFPSRTHWDD